VFGERVWQDTETGRLGLCQNAKKYDNVSIAARLISNSQHARMLRFVQPGRRAEDAFPTVYRLNTRRGIRKYFTATSLRDISYLYCFEAQYFLNSRVVYRGFQFLHWLLPAALHGNLYVFLKKRWVAALVAHNHGPGIFGMQTRLQFSSPQRPQPA
jgi:hypothetical protein